MARFTSAAAFRPRGAEALLPGDARRGLEDDRPGQDRRADQGGVRGAEGVRGLPRKPRLDNFIKLYFGQFTEQGY